MVTEHQGITTKLDMELARKAERELLEGRQPRTWTEAVLSLSDDKLRAFCNRLQDAALLQSGWWQPIVGIPIGFGIAYWFIRKVQEWVILYQIEPVAAFLGLNAIGIVAVYSGIRAINYARDITTPKAVTNPPTRVSTIAQTIFPFRKSSHSIPASIQIPPHPSQAQTMMAMPNGNSIQPISLYKAARSTYLVLLRLFRRKEN